MAKISMHNSDYHSKENYNLIGLFNIDYHLYISRQGNVLTYTNAFQGIYIYILTYILNFRHKRVFNGKIAKYIVLQKDESLLV